MPFGCIFVPDFPVNAIVRAEPGLHSRAVAVLEGKPPLEKVAAVNEEAQDAGIYPGMTKLQAELCENVTLRNRSPLQEAAAHCALLDCVQSFSPRVEDVAADTAMLDLCGLGKLFGPLPKIAREIFRRAAAMGLETNVAVAANLEAALLAARGFSGVTVVPEGKEAEILGGLPVAVLMTEDADPKQAEEFLQTCRRWGVHKFREFAALPEMELSQRLGQRGIELQRKARGMGVRTLAPSDPPLTFEEAIELEHPLLLLEPLAFVLNRMIEQFCVRLQARALAAQELCLELELEIAHPVAKSATRMGQAEFERTIHLPVPLLDPKTLLNLLQLDLKSHPPGSPVQAVRLRIEPARPRTAQNGLFQPASPEPEKLELTLARIGSVVGEGRAGSCELLDTHRREAFEMKRFVPPAHKNGNNGAPERKELVTALRIFRPPIPVSVSSQNGKPARISSIRREKISGEVLWAAGPWRSSGDWWEQDAWIRDEWDIGLCQHNQMALYRLVHDVMEGKWILEGSYD